MDVTEKCERGSFIKKLLKKIAIDEKANPGDAYLINIKGKFGHYQLMLVKRKDGNGWQIEINGEIHHLFLTPNGLRPLPTKNQIMNNLKDTVILKELHIHLLDQTGNGDLMFVSPDKILQAREYINLAGVLGNKLLANARKKKSISLTAYKIVQKDILDQAVD